MLRLRRFAELCVLIGVVGCGPRAPAPTQSEAQPTQPREAATALPATMPDLGGRHVVIGTDATYPPFEYVDDATDEIVGFDVDLMNAIADLIKIEPEFQNADFKTIFTALQSKQYDAVMSAATITEERQKIVAFSDAYLEVGQLVVTAVDNAQITSYTDLADGPRVGVQTGTTGEEAALTQAGVPEGSLMRYDTIDLANRSIDAVVADGPTVGNYVSQPQYAGKLKIVGQPFTTESYGIAVHKDDTELLEAINLALEELKADGTVERLREQYKIK